MIRICSFCLEVIGEKEPLEDKSETHGACDKCLIEELEKIKNDEKKEDQ